MSKIETLFQDKLGLPPGYEKQLLGLLKRHHTAFGLSAEERGEINLEVNTGTSEPKKQRAR